MNGELSLWDRFKIAITPVSHAEQTVNDIYGPDGRGMIPVPKNYEPELASQPAVYVDVKQDIAEVYTSAKEGLAQATAGIQSSLVKFGIVAFIAIAALIAIYAFIRR